MERLEELKLLVDWERGKVYRDRGLMSRLLSTFGVGLEEIEVTEDLTSRIVKDRLRWLYTRATLKGSKELKTSTPEGELKVTFEPERVIVEGPRYRLEYTTSVALMVDKETGKEERRPIDLKSFGEFYREMKELLGYGGIEEFATAKAKEVRREAYEPAGSGLFWIGSGLLTGLILSEIYHHILHQEGSSPEGFDQDTVLADHGELDSLEDSFFDDFDMV